MGRKKMRKRLFCLLGVIFIFIASVSPIVYAEENEQTKPVANTNMLTSSSDSWFATKEELLKFNTDDTDGDKLAKKVYFGVNGSNEQEWWIVGKDPSGGGLVLFAASPLATGQMFEYMIYRPKAYQSGWGTYAAGSEINEVNPNHYGGSRLRKDLLFMMNGTKYFSLTEKEMMKETIVATYDTKNNCTYTTADKLYALHSTGNLARDGYGTAGTNNGNSLDAGLKITKNYFPNGTFWFRTPGGMYNSAIISGSFYDTLCYYTYDRVPAFQLDLTSVLFASSAKAATSNGNLATSDTFTLRYKEDNNNLIGSVKVDALTNTINVENAKDGAYLVVQNSKGAWGQAVSGDTQIDVSTININGESLVSSERYKVWLEYTNERITKATMPIDLLKASTPGINTTQTASTITITELADQDKYGKAQYKLVDGSNATSGWKDSNVFDKLKANTDYTIYAKYLGKDNYLASEDSTTIKTSSAQYTITIPQSVTAGDNSSAVEIAVNKNDKFDLGHNGQVYVKVSNNGAIKDGKLTLTRQNDTSNQTITSAMYVNNNLFDNINKNVAEFSSISDPAVSVSFGKPSVSQGKVIPAGDYRATVTYEIKYKELP